MNCTSHERHLGRRLTLATIDGQVTQIDRQEKVATGLLKSVRSKPEPSNDVRLRFADGTESSLSVRGRRFSVAPGHRVVAVRASGSRNGTEVLYCYSHETKRDWFNNKALSKVRRAAPYRMLLWVLPLLALLALWMSPQQTRADLISRLSVMMNEPEQARAAESAANPAPRLFGQSRTAQHSAPAATGWASQPITLESIRESFTRFMLTGWRDGSWLAFGVLASLLIPLLFMLGQVFIIWPASRSLRRRTKRLAHQHIQAMKAA